MQIPQKILKEAFKTLLATSLQAFNDCEPLRQYRCATTYHLERE